MADANLLLACLKLVLQPCNLCMRGIRARLLVCILKRFNKALCI